MLVNNFLKIVIFVAVSANFLSYKKSKTNAHPHALRNKNRKTIFFFLLDKLNGFFKNVSIAVFLFFYYN